MKESKAQKIESWLKKGYSITGLEAISMFKVYRLSVVIHRLRKKGLKIHCDMDKGYARYYMPSSLNDVLEDIGIA